MLTLIQFLSTLSLRRATTALAVLLMCNLYFYPRSPCGERPTTIITICIASKFLSTLSLRRATLAGPSGPAFLYNFYPRSPCGERHWRPATNLLCLYFYPRSPCGERLWANFSGFFWWVISIHALLAESDSQHPPGTTSTTYFYPRSPCGERRKPNKLTGLKLVFLSTLSLRRATKECTYFYPHCPDFYPRSPCGERPDEPSGEEPEKDFYPRSPCGERQLIA